MRQNPHVSWPGWTRPALISTNTGPSQAAAAARTGKPPAVSTVASDRGILDSWSTTTSWGSRGSAVG